MLFITSNPRCNVSGHTCGGGCGSECSRMPLCYCRCALHCCTCKWTVTGIYLFTRSYVYYPTAGVPERQYEDISFNRIRDMITHGNQLGRRGRPCLVNGWKRGRDIPAVTGSGRHKPEYLIGGVLYHIVRHILSYIYIRKPATFTVYI